ncbi:MAG: hypothetical protein ACK56I_25500, partial [bacterium]
MVGEPYGPRAREQQPPDDRSPVEGARRQPPQRSDDLAPDGGRSGPLGLHARPRGGQAGGHQRAPRDSLHPQPRSQQPCIGQPQQRPGGKQRPPEATARQADHGSLAGCGRVHGPSLPRTRARSRA